MLSLPLSAASPAFLAQSSEQLEGLLEQPYQDSAAPAPTPPANAVGLLVLTICAGLFLLFLLYKRRFREVRATLPIVLFITVTLAALTVSRWPSPPRLADERSGDRSPVAAPRDLGTKTGETEAEAEAREPEAEERDTAEAEVDAAAATAGDPDAASESANGSMVAEAEARAAAEAETTTAERAISAARARAASPSDTSAGTRSVRSPANPVTPSGRVTRQSTASATAASVGGGRSRESNVDYRQLPASVTFRTVLQRGDRGYDVTLLQRLLADLGYYERAADGDFGRYTEAAVEAFQRDRNLAVDGIVGFSTCNILRTLALEQTRPPLETTTMHCS